MKRTLYHGWSMEIRAYGDVYLNEAKRHLGTATDYLVNACGFAADTLERHW